METLATILQLIRPSMYLAKLDFKDTYYSIPIYEPHQKLYENYKTNVITGVNSQGVIQKSFLGGGSTKKCNQDCDQALTKSTWGSA